MDNKQEQNPSREELKARLQARLKYNKQSRQGSFSRENSLRKMEVPDDLIFPLLNCGKVFPYPDEVLKTFKNLSKTEIKQKVEEINTIVANLGKGY
jgi:hypothetical protein